MNERFLRSRFSQLKISEKLTLMEELSVRYGILFKGLYAFSRWGQGIITGVFEKDGREFVFVPGGAVTLGWDGFAVGMNRQTKAEFQGAFEEFGYKGTVEEFLRLSMTPVRQAKIGPMLVSYRLEEIGWEPITMEDPRLKARPDWLEDWKGMRILDAVWHAPEKKAVIRLEKSDDIPMLLRIGTRTFDFTAELDGRPVAFRQDVLNGAAEFPLPAAGTLTLAF